MENDFNKIINVIKSAAVTAVENTKPATMLIGVVVSESPLEIALDSTLIIPEDHIMLTKNTCEWTMEMSVDHVTENRAGGGGDADLYDFMDEKSRPFDEAAIITTIKVVRST